MEFVNFLENCLVFVIFLEKCLVFVIFLENCREQLRFRNFFAARSAYFGEIIDDCFIFGKIMVKSFVNFSVF